MNEAFRRTKAASCASGHALDANEMDLINKYTLRTLSPQEVFAFKVTACDNEVDRDNEAFTTSTLEQLGKMFAGRTVITDHNAHSGNQCARIYAAETVAVQDKKTSYGEQYVRLEARCYLPREGNTQLITMIETGMRKEVSVGCAVTRMSCSICGKPYISSECAHRAGKDGCFVKLEDAKDAYELSFVAVPAQSAAGVIKGSDTKAEQGFYAEMHSLINLVKETHGLIRCLEKCFVGVDMSSKPDVTIISPFLDPQVEALILSANALVKNSEGDIYK